VSDIKTTVRKITNIHPLPGADRLVLAEIDGWQVVVGKDQFVDGDKIIYFQIDTVIPEEIAVALNVKQYLKEKVDIHGNKVLVVGKVKLKGEPSYGLVMCAEEHMRVGDEVDMMYGSHKFEPPVKWSAQQGRSLSEKLLPDFEKYTDISNLRNFPDVFTDGEMVAVFEKIHGTCSRIDLGRGRFSRFFDWILKRDRRFVVAASKNKRREEPSWFNRMLRKDVNFITDSADLYWLPMRNENFREMLYGLGRLHKTVEIYGEIYGGGIQDYDYGQKEPTYCCFDIQVDGRYMDYDELLATCTVFGVTSAPYIAVIPYKFDDIVMLSGKTNGRQSALNVKYPPHHMAEGLVVRPIKERKHPKVGRLIMKYVSDNYLNRGKDESTDE
jgi:RNA ligase (TIGR02306 family)